MPGSHPTLLTPVRGLVRIVLLAAVSVSCGADEPTDAAVARDSAGIRIVESASPRWDEDDAWVVDPEPVLDLAASGTGPAHEFFRVVDALRLADGTLVVADRGSAQVRFFSPEGEFLGSVGREGEGPGEFERLTSVDRFRGDSLIAFDYWQRRITVLGPAREVARTVALNELERVWRLHPLASGDFIAMLESLRAVAGHQGLTRIPSPIATLASDGVVRDTILVIPGDETYVFDGGSAASPFGRSTYMAVDGSRVYLGSADRMEIEVYSRDGRLERLVRIPDYDLRLSEAELREERALIYPDNLPARLREVADAIPDPETRPAYSNLLIDDSGHLWAAEFHGRTEQDDPTDWEVFDPEGEWLGTVRMPAHFKAFEIGENYVLGRRLDELDVQHVELLRLERR